jgi:hypothetical protein
MISLSMLLPRLRRLISCLTKEHNVFSELSEKTDDNVTTWKTTFSKDFTEVEEIARLISSKFK